MRREVFTCDICGKERGESNHWFLAYDAKTMETVYRWDDDRAGGKDMKHLCGAECAHALLSRFMEAK